MVSKELRYERTEFNICDDYDNDCYNEYHAIAQQKEIIEIARKLNSFGDEFLRDLTVKADSKVEGYFDVGGSYTGLGSVVGTVDTLLVWLEQSGNNMMEDLRKREAVLRGVLRLTELGSQASLFGMLELACKFLDVPDDPYPAEREYITGCLTETEKQKQRIFRIIEEAGDILKAIIEAENLDVTEMMKFDNVLREAQVEMKSCRRRLDGAKQIIVKLAQRMRVVKWFSRCVRAIGLGISWYFLYHKYQESSLSLSLMLVGFFVSAGMWLSFFPRRAYSFYESLSKLDAKHRLLNEGLDEIHERLKSSIDHKDRVVEMIRSGTGDN